MPSPRYLLTLDDYLNREQASAVRHEFVNGQLFAMTGTTLRHNVIVHNIYSLLKDYLKTSKCRIYTSDVKVLAEAANSVYYPDVVVSCAKFDAESLFASRPVFIAEVLSPSTRNIDTREKASAYQQIDSVREYMVVHQKRKALQLFRRIDEQRWQALIFGNGSTVELMAFPGEGLEFSIDAVYETLDYPQQDSAFTVREENLTYEIDEEDEDW